MKRLKCFFSSKAKLIFEAFSFEFVNQNFSIYCIEIRKKQIENLN
jgi:hypothetical protein